MGRVLALGVLGACALGFTCLIALFVQAAVGGGGDDSPVATPAKEMQLAHVPKMMQAKAAAAPKATKSKLDVRNQARLVHHPHVQYVNDVDEGLNQAVEQERLRNIKEGSIPHPPHFHHHTATADHNLDTVPMPPLHPAVAGDGDGDAQDESENSTGDGNDSSQAADMPPGYTSTDSAIATTTTTTDDSDDDTPTNTQHAVATRERVESARQKINSGVKTLKGYVRKINQRHNLLVRIHNHEREVHDRLRAVQQHQAAVKKQLMQMSKHDRQLHLHEIAVAKKQRDVARRESRLANELKHVQQRLKKEQAMMQKHRENEFHHLVKVESDILNKIRHGAFLRPPKSMRGHHVRINVNSPGGKAAPVHVRLRAKELGDNGDIDININRNLHKLGNKNKKDSNDKRKGKVGGGSSKKHKVPGNRKRVPAPSSIPLPTKESVSAALERIDRMIVVTRQKAKNAAEAAASLENKKKKPTAAVAARAKH